MKSRTDGKNEPRKPKPEPDDKEPSARFIETAKALEADKNSSQFERAVNIITPPKSATKNKK
jgi:hypothetical protein